MQSWLPGLLAVVALAASGARAAETPLITGAVIPESTIGAVIHVDGSSADAQDSNAGTADNRLRSIIAAVKKAEANNLKGVATKILIYPGVYRESIRIDGAKQRTDAPIVFEARESGKAVISGSDIWQDWKQTDRPGIYTHPWPYKWGVAPNPWAQYGIDLKPIGRRREMVFVNGQLMRQAMTDAELREGSFLVSEEKQEIRLFALAATDLQKSTVEVGVRDGIFYVNGAQQRVRNIVLRGLVFQNDCCAYGWVGTPMFEYADNVLVEDCVARWNNSDGGFKFARCRDITLRRCRSEHSANAGLNMHSVQNVVMEDVDCSDNNWRGAWADFRHWHPAGAKFFRLRGLMLTRFTASRNEACGLWFDTDCADIIVDRARITQNSFYGMYIEASQGPVWLKNSVIANNRRAGLLNCASGSMYVTGNTIYGNGEGQFVVEPAAGNVRDGDNMMTGEHERFRMGNWTMSDNTFVSTSDQQPLLSLPRVDFLLQTLVMGKNLYQGPAGGALFKLAARNLSLAQWQTSSGVDLDSIQADPRFADTATGDFSVLADSPLKNKQKWPRRDAAETGEAAVAARQVQVQKNWQTAYPLAGQIDQWQQLNLAPLANHAMDGSPKAWMGGGGLNFRAAGQVGIHGVPFRIIQRSDNDGKDLIALASTRLNKLLERTLPAEVTVPVGAPARAIYILHGAVHAQAGPAGEYHFIYEDGTEEVVKLISLGYVNQPDAAQLAQRQAEANIQDWSAPPLEQDDVRKVMLLGREDPLDDGALHYLYTLQWRNPHPEKAVREIRLQSDATREVCLMVLAITAGR